MGSESRRQRHQTPTIKGGRITQAIVASPRSSLSPNVHTLPRADEEELGLHTTHLDYDHSKHLPSQTPRKPHLVSSTAGSRLGSNTSCASSAGRQAASYASRAAAPPLEDKPQQVSRLENQGHAMSPFQALAEGVKKSSNQLPHLRAPLRNITIPEPKKIVTSRSLPPHLRAPSSVVSSQVANGSLPPHMRARSSIVSSQASKVRSFHGRYLLNGTPWTFLDLLNSSSDAVFEACIEVLIEAKWVILISS